MKPYVIVILSLAILSSLSKMVVANDGKDLLGAIIALLAQTLALIFVCVGW